ncbi:PstS family phosphate ABC transporter substrate-binding protein [Pedobacter metabolipauper]|uniref:Phosphate ABC transporter substrate-binding protein (PhoT family) n=1 Tax=Pedobacter metabolipauper TaxID=425513 RepID=A0A4R6SWK5_9SPHI|nr:substrate-binding domain-containing protein [Pedobacter metabolipauper]TDQ09801.1 phosphate ABC transporter substrate-binding protein (PhoT family) [Pedobacter metabolipauper]
MKNLSFILILLVLAACNGGGKKGDAPVETRTSGTVKILVDESFSAIIDDQIEVFKSDYKDAGFTVTYGNENKIMPTFLNDSIRVIILSRMLTADEDTIYRKRSIVPKTSRFAIDGIALITGKNNPDSVITAQEIFDILKGESTSRSLVFDNAYSSTVRYFKDSAGVKDFPKQGVYSMKDNNEVIKYVSENENSIGIVGVNWLLQNNKSGLESLSKVKMMGVKNLKGKKGDDAFYKPDQTNLISGIYPFLRNVYIINCEGRDGLGTGFANWLMSPRGQLIVLRSGLGPHQIAPREFNIKKPN